MRETDTQAARPERALLKSCGTCQLCCKVYDIDDIGKKAGDMCFNARGAQGCGIWGIHPKICREFQCLWLKHPDMGPLWRPDLAGFVLKVEPNETTLSVDVDHDRPFAWRLEPYYSQLKKWSEVFIKGEGLVLVYAPEGLYVLTPEEDLFLKTPKRGDILETGMELTLFGPKPFARVIPNKHTKLKAAPKRQKRDAA